MTTEIIQAKPEDAATVAMLKRITFAETFGHLFRSHLQELRIYLDMTFGVGKIATSLGKSENAYWLAFRDRLPVGYAKLKHPFGPSDQVAKDAAQLQKIYVRDRARSSRRRHAQISLGPNKLVNCRQAAFDRQTQR